MLFAMSFNESGTILYVVISQANKEEDGLTRTTAANVAARAAFGGNDMLSKWQLMAEQARQKREVSSDPASTSQPTRDINQNTTSLSGIIENHTHETEKMVISSDTGTISGKY